MRPICLRDSALKKATIQPNPARENQGRQHHTASCCSWLILVQCQRQRTSSSLGNEWLLAGGCAGIGGAKELKISAITTVTTKIRFDIGQPRS